MKFFRGKILSYLDNWESRLQLDIRYFAKGGLWATVQQCIGVTSGLILSFIFGHFLSKTVFGEYNLILSFLGMLTFLSLPGLDLFLPKSIANQYDASFSLAWKMKFKLSLLGLPILFIASAYYYLNQQTTLSVTLLISGCLFPFLNPFTCYPAFLIGKKRFRDLAIISAFSSLVFLFLVGIVSIFISRTTPLILAYFSGLVLPAVIGYWYSLRFIHNRKIDKDLGKYGSFLTILSVLPWISGNLGQVILGNLMGVETLAIFAVAGRFLTAVQKNFQVFYKPITGKLAAQTPQDHLTILKRHAVKLLLVGLGLSTALWIATPYLITWFFTDLYKDAIIYARVLSLSLIPFPLTLVVTDIVVFQKHKTPQIFMSILPNIIKIGLYFLLIPLWKMWGLVFIILIDRFTEPLIPILYLLKSSRKTS